MMVRSNWLSNVRKVMKCSSISNAVLLLGRFFYAFGCAIFSVNMEGNCCDMFLGIWFHDARMKRCFYFSAISFGSRNGFCSFLVFGCFWFLTYRLIPFSFYLCTHQTSLYIHHRDMTISLDWAFFLDRSIHAWNVVPFLYETYNK